MFFVRCLISLSRGVFANALVVTLWKRPRWAAPIALALIVLLVGSNAWVSRLVRSLEGKISHLLNFQMQKQLSSWVVQQNQLFHHAHR